ncbi:hypothetical protein PG988_006121 [Apiospora saccharicola]
MQFFGPVVLLSLLVAMPQAMPTNEPPPLAPRIPRGQPEGTYVIHNPGTPNELHERLPDLPESSRLEPAARRSETSPLPDALLKRDDYIACGCVDLNPTDCDNATHDLEAQAGTGKLVDVGGCLYSVKGSVVAFICAYQVPDGSSAINLNSGWHVITRECGLYKAGTRGRRGMYGEGYMRSDHVDFRGDAWGSWRNSC